MLFHHTNVTMNVTDELQPLNNECLIFIIFLVVDDILVVTICTGYLFIYLFSNKPINLGLCGSTVLLCWYTPICLYSQKRNLPGVYLKSRLPPSLFKTSFSWLCHNPSLKKTDRCRTHNPKKVIFIFFFH